MIFGAVVMSLTITLSGLQAFAQEKDEQVVFNGRHVMLKNTGRKDTIKLIDAGEEISKILSLLRPISIDSKNIGAEKTPYRLSNMVQKCIVDALCHGKYLKSLNDGTPMPDGYFCLGLTDIVVSADGSVAYYNFYNSSFYVEKDSMTRIVDLKLEMDKVIKESCKATKFNFKDAYLLLHIDISKIKFSVHNGVVNCTTTP